MFVGCGKERIWELITHHPVMHFPKMPDYKVLGQLQLASQLQNPVTITWWKSHLLQRQVTPQELTPGLLTSPEVLIPKEYRLIPMILKLRQTLLPVQQILEPTRKRWWITWRAPWNPLLKN